MRPLVEEWWQARKTRVRRLAADIESRISIVVVLVLVAAAGFFAVAALARSALALIAYQWCANHPLLVALAVGLYALLLAMRLRSNLSLEYAQSWLRSTPISARSFAAMIAMRIAINIVVQAALTGAIALLFALAARRATVPLLLPLLGGFAIGGVLGAICPQPSMRQASEASRFVLKAPHNDAPSLEGLSRWPVLAALAWHRPENSRWLFIAAALSVPMGSSALLGVAILAVWSLGSYLLALVRCLSSVAAQAAHWLRPTTISFPRFAWALVRRVLIHQCIGTVIFCAALIAVGANVGDALYVGSVWLSLVCMMSAIGTSRAFLARAPTVRTVASVAAVLATESAARGFGIALSALIALAHVRGGTHARP